MEIKFNTAHLLTTLDTITSNTHAKNSPQGKAQDTLKSAEPKYDLSMSKTLFKEAPKQVPTDVGCTQTDSGCYQTQSGCHGTDSGCYWTQSGC